jgi:hypothetical protein
MTNLDAWLFSFAHRFDQVDEGMWHKTDVISRSLR